MRLGGLVLLLLVAALPGRGDDAATQPAQPAPLTLPEAIAQALETNPRMAIAGAGVRAAKAQRDAAHAAGLPTVDLNVNPRLQAPEVNIIQAKNSPIPGAPPNLTSRVLTPTKIVEGTLDVNAPLYNGGRVAAQRRAARHAGRAALARVQSEGQRLVFDVTQAYLNVLENRRQVDLAARVRELSEERLRVAQVRQRAGVALLYETLQSESDLAQAVQREIDAGARLGTTGATLNSLIGRPASTPLNVADLPETEPTHPQLMPESGPLTPEQLRDLGLERPDLQALREEVRRGDAEIQIARAARRPQINGFTNYLRRVPATFNGVFFWSLGASIVQSLFDGGRARAAVDQARAERSRRKAVLEDAERTADEQVEQARILLDAAEKRLAAEEKRVVAAEAGLDVARRRLRAGTAAPVEVTEAETTLARAQTDALTARFDLANARVRLAYVAGLAYPETVPSLAVTPPPKR
jgi:outer membrane protein TolC